MPTSTLSTQLKGAIFIPNYTQKFKRKGGITMSKRTFKNGHLVSTFSCNKGFVTVLYGKYGLQIRSIYATTPTQAKRNHSQFLSYC